MVEGHQCHRVAAAHRKLMVGRAFKATSPNARFAAGAAAINGKRLAKIEVHGKNIFYFFARESPTKLPSTAAKAVTGTHDIVHVHFGMAGAFKTMRRPGEAPTPTTRLRLESSELDLVAHLSAMTVNHGDDAYYAYAAAIQVQQCSMCLHGDVCAACTIISTRHDCAYSSVTAHNKTAYDCGETSSLDAMIVLQRRTIRVLRTSAVQGACSRVGPGPAAGGRGRRDAVGGGAGEQEADRPRADGPDDDRGAGQHLPR